MPNRREHLAKADANAETLASIAAERSSPEWAITVAFYRAVHLVEAWSALRDRHHRNHRRRNETVNRLLPEIAADYGELYEASRVARYDPLGLLDWGDYDRLVMGLDRIEAHLRSAIR